MDTADPVLYRTPGSADGSPGDLSRDPSPRPDDTSPTNDTAAVNGSGIIDLPELAGLLSLLGGSESSGTSCRGEEPGKASCDNRHSGGGSHDDTAVRLLRALSPYLQDTRVLSVDRVIQLLETARGIRGILHTFGPLLGDLRGGKS